MQETIAELDRLTSLCDRIHLQDAGKHSRTLLLESLSEVIGAESAAFRSLTLCKGEPQLHAMANCGIPAAVHEAYLEHFYRLDPVLKILPQLYGSDSAPTHTYGNGLSLEEVSSLILPADKRPVPTSEFLRCLQQYRDQFLLPNRLCHHLGFLLREGKDRIWLFNFHRPAPAHDFNALERARVKLISRILQQQQAGLPLPATQAGLRLSQLSPRERDVAMAIAQGLANKQVAETLGISIRTVENHLRNIYDKLAISSRTQLASLFYQHQEAV